MTIALDITSGVCWSIVYIAAIVLGYRYKTWCIPQLAVCQNFAWELFVVISRIMSKSFDIAFGIQLTWLIMDVGILLTWLLYDNVGKNVWIRKLLLLLSVSMLVYLFTIIVGYWEITAFVINAIMSAAFIIRTIRGNEEVRSPLIACAKLVGTLAATILNGVVVHNVLVLWIGGICLILDVYYCLLFMSNSLIGDLKNEKSKTV